MHITLRCFSSPLLDFYHFWCWIVCAAAGCPPKGRLSALFSYTASFGKGVCREKSLMAGSWLSPHPMFWTGFASFCFAICKSRDCRGTARSFLQPIAASGSCAITNPANEWNCASNPTSSCSSLTRNQQQRHPNKLMFMSELNLLSLSSFRDKSYQHAYLGLEGIPMIIQKSNNMIIRM